jgi:cytochrome c biogenesis protein ResB
MTFAPPPPPVKPRNNVRTILIVVGIVLVLCCGGVAVGGFFLVKGVANSVGPVREGATGYVDDLIEHDYPGAYDQLCTRVTAKMSEEVFAGVMRRTADIRSWDVTGTNVSNMNGTATGSVTMRLTLNDGSSRTQTFPMVKEGEDWKVCDL